MNKFFKKFAAVALAFALMVVSVPFTASAEVTDVNIQFNAYGGEFQIKYDGEDLMDLNAPHCVYGVKPGESSEDKGVKITKDPIWVADNSNHMFLGWVAKGLKPDETTLEVIADYNNPFTTKEALEYIPDGTYMTVFFDAYWGLDNDGNYIKNQEFTNNKRGIHFEVPEGSAEFEYKGDEFDLYYGRFYVNDGESASDYGNVTDVKHDLLGAIDYTWNLRIVNNGVEQEEISGFTTAQALAFEADETNYPECNYEFYVEWIMPETVSVQFTSYGHLFEASDVRDENGPTDTDSWGNETYIGYSWKELGYSVTDPTWNTDRAETGEFLGWNMYGRKTEDDEFELLEEKLSTEAALDMKVTDTYECILFEAVWNVNHTLGDELEKANYTDCGGGFKTDFYICKICGEPVDADGNAMKYWEPITNHTLGEKMAPNYMPCTGGFKTEWYMCSICEYPLDADGNDIEFVEPEENAKHKLEKVPGYMPTYEDFGVLDYWQCQYCWAAFLDNQGLMEIYDESQLIIPKLEEDLKQVTTELTSISPDLSREYTVETVKEIFASVVEESFPDVTVSEVQDVKLMVETSTGVWEEVEAANFPAEGVTVKFDYPAGKSAGDYGSIIIVHMISNGANAGEFEVIPTYLAEDGYYATFTSMSPIMTVFYDPTPEESAKPEHTHNWSSEYKITENSHSKYCKSCGTKKSKHPHVDVNKDGHCDACDYAVTTVSAGRTNPNTGV